MKKLAVLVGLTIALSLTAAAVSQEEGGDLEFGLLSEPSSLDPHVYAGDQTMVIKQLVYSTLVRFGSDGGQLVGDLAEEWQTPDPHTYVFELRPDAVFHDGTPVTARDVKYSLERILDPSSSATRRNDLEVIDGIDVLDEHTVQVTLSAPNAAFLAFLARPESAVVSEEFVEAGADLATEMMGSGPFRFEEYNQGIELVIVRNEDYFIDELPYLDSVRFVPIADDNTRVNALRGGEVDVIQFIPWTAMAQIEDSPDLELYPHADAVMFLQFNVQRAPFDDRRVRQAVAHAINRQAVLQAAFLGRGSVITGGVIPPDHWAHNAGLEGTYTHDPDQARELLEEAGAVGTEVEIDTYSLPFAVQTAEVVQNNLEEVGLQAEIIVSEWPTYQEKTSAEGDFQARVYGAGWRVPDLDFWTPFVGSGGEFADPAGFGDEELDNLLEQGRTTLDQDERRDIYRRVEERVLELSPMAFISWRVNAWAASAAVDGLSLVPDPMGPLSGYELARVWLSRP